MLARASIATLLVGMLGAAVAAGASIPTGEWHGAWHVVSITSLSGIAGDDAAAVMAQETEAGRIKIDWEQGRAVVISIDVEHCRGEDEDFTQVYAVDPARWVRQRDGGARRLRADFSAWLDQARLACRSGVRLDLFRLTGLRAAAADFTARVRELGSL